MSRCDGCGGNHPYTEHELADLQKRFASMEDSVLVGYNTRHTSNFANGLDRLPNAQAIQEQNELRFRSIFSSRVKQNLEGMKRNYRRWLFFGTNLAAPLGLC